MKELARKIFIRAIASKVADDSEYQQQTDFAADTQSCLQAAAAFLAIAERKG